MRMYVLIHMHACTHVHLYKEYCIIWGSKMTFLVTLYVYHSLLMSSFYQLGWSLVITHLYWIFLVHCIWSFSKLCYNFCLAFKCNLEIFFFSSLLVLFCLRVLGKSVKHWLLWSEGDKRLRKCAMHIADAAGASISLQSSDTTLMVLYPWDAGKEDRVAEGRYGRDDPR